MNLKKILSFYDFWLFGAVIALSVFGVVAIGSAMHINQGEGTSTFYSQIVWVITGTVLMITASFVNIDFFGRLYKLIYLVNIAMLVLVLAVGTGDGVSRWIRIGPMSIQPSEFAKVMMIFFLAKFIDKNGEKINNISCIGLTVLLGVIPALLIIKQPSLSAGLVILAILVVMLFAGGLDAKIIFKAAIVIIPLLTLFLLDAQREAPFIADKILSEYQLGRILTFIDPTRDPDTYYQTLQSINAIGSGGVNGKGLYLGTLSQLSYLPEPQNDFIFTVIGEEFGFFGCMAVVIAICFIVIRILIIAITTDKMFYRLICAGTAGMIAFQAFVNMGVATGILPNTGMSLPFVSYGGSAMWTYMTSVGLCLNVGLKRSKSIF